MPDVWSRLKHQSRPHRPDPAVEAFAAALEAQYAAGVHDFGAVAAALSAQGVAGPKSGRRDWTADSLGAELAALNADLDQAYARDGFGA